MNHELSIMSTFGPHLVSPDRPVLAWHFLPYDQRLRYGDGRKVEVGETLCVEPIQHGTRGLHASQKVIHAIGHCTGLYHQPKESRYPKETNLCCRVACFGQVIFDSHMITCSHRKVIAMADCSFEFQQFLFDLVENVASQRPKNVKVPAEPGEPCGYEQTQRWIKKLTSTTQAACVTNEYRRFYTMYLLFHRDFIAEREVLNTTLETKLLRRLGCE